MWNETIGKCCHFQNIMLNVIEARVRCMSEAPNSGLLLIDSRKLTTLLWTLWVCTYSVSYVVVVLIMINNRMHNLQRPLRVILHLVSILFFPELVCICSFLMSKPIYDKYMIDPKMTCASGYYWPCWLILWNVLHTQVANICLIDMRNTNVYFRNDISKKKIYLRRCNEIYLENPVQFHLKKKCFTNYFFHWENLH